MIKVTQSVMVSLALLAGIMFSSHSGALESSDIAQLMCEGNRNGIANMAKAYEETPTSMVAKTLKSAFETEPHKATREFMAEVVNYVIGQGNRGTRYLESDRFMTSCLAVMNQKMAGMRAQTRQQGQKMNQNTVNMPPQQDQRGQMAPRESNSSLDMSNRR